MIQDLRNNFGAGNGDQTRDPRLDRVGAVRADRAYNLPMSHHSRLR